MDNINYKSRFSAKLIEILKEWKVADNQDKILSKLV
jgi:hypothetical protein